MSTSISSSTKNQLGRALMQAWMKRGWFACLAWPLAQLFGGVIKLRAFVYRIGWLPQHKLPVPVIVVGNIFIGGTGKTPFTLWLLDQLKQAGYKPGVISRGYGRTQDASRVVLPDSDAARVGDEPLLIAQKSACPVVVARRRIDAGRYLLATFPDVNVIVSDDGLQHLALARDVEIMLFDARGVGNGWLLPAGPLREPSSRKRDITVANLNEGESISEALPHDTTRMQLKGIRMYPLMDARQIKPLSSFDVGLKIVAAAGIGHPQRFFSMLHQQGVQCATMPLPDHFHYLTNPFKDLVADVILITEKDAVKCRQTKDIASDARIWVVMAEAEIDAGLMEKILKKLSIGEKSGPSIA